MGREQQVNYDLGPLIFAAGYGYEKRAHNLVRSFLQNRSERLDLFPFELAVV
jgi:hypothetical protein